MNVLNVNELYTSKWLNLCYMALTSIKKIMIVGKHELEFLQVGVTALDQHIKLLSTKSIILHLIH